MHYLLQCVAFMRSGRKRANDLQPAIVRGTKAHTDLPSGTVAQLKTRLEGALTAIRSDERLALNVEAYTSTRMVHFKNTMSPISNSRRQKLDWQLLVHYAEHLLAIARRNIAPRAPGTACLANLDRDTMRHIVGFLAPVNNLRQMSYQAFGRAMYPVAAMARINVRWRDACRLFSNDTKRRVQWLKNINQYLSSTVYSYNPRNVNPTTTLTRLGVSPADLAPLKVVCVLPGSGAYPHTHSYQSSAGQMYHLGDIYEQLAKTWSLEALDAGLARVTMPDDQYFARVAQGMRLPGFAQAQVERLQRYLVDFPHLRLDYSNTMVREFVSGISRGGRGTVSHGLHTPNAVGISLQRDYDIVQRRRRVDSLQLQLNTLMGVPNNPASIADTFGEFLQGNSAIQEQMLSAFETFVAQTAREKHERAVHARVDAQRLAEYRQLQEEQRAKFNPDFAGVKRRREDRDGDGNARAGSAQRRF